MKHILEQVLSDITGHRAEADLVLSRSKSLKISAQNETLSEYNVSSSQILGVRLIKDERVGLAYTESLDDESLKLMIKQALQNAESNDPNPYENILGLSGSLEDGITRPKDDIDVSVKIERVLELEKGVKRGDARVQAVPYNGYSEADYESHYMSSSGRYTRYADHSYQVWTSALLSEGDKKATYFDYDLSHDFDGLNWKKVIDESLRHAQDLLKEKPIPTGKYPVMFRLDNLKNLIGVFSHIFSAKAVMDKINPWESKLGDLVASSDLTIIDHPSFERSFRKTLFDGEGVERKILPLIQDGVLQSFYHNSMTASVLGTKTTAHASRGAQGPLSIAGTDLLIHGRNPKSLPSKYLEVIQLDGLHAGTNKVTGDFSLPVKGYVIENGDRVMTFGNVTLSGNFFEMLKSVQVCGSDLGASTDRSFFSVPLVFHELSIAGARSL